MRRVALFLTALALVLLLPASPAAAHTVGGVGATNFRTTLSAVTPAVPGIDLSVVENGSQLQLTNTTAQDVIVSGYGGEPYARVGPGGVSVNDNSPATYVNADRFSRAQVPAGVDPSAPPRWRAVGSEPVWRWHDHRVHWMLQTLPPAVVADPTTEHRISAWTVSLTYGSSQLTATGTLDWVPGPSPWPWVVAGLGVLLLVAGAGLLGSPHRALAGAALLLVVTDLVHGLGAMVATVGTVPERLGALFGSDALLIWPFALLAAWLLWRRHTRAAWLGAVVGLVIAVAVAVDDAPTLWRSSAPTALPVALDRACIAVILGLGLGLVAAVPLLLHRHPPTPRPWLPTPTAPAPPAPGSPAPGSPVPAPRRTSAHDLGRRRVLGDQVTALSPRSTGAGGALPVSARDLGAAGVAGDQVTPIGPRSTGATGARDGGGAGGAGDPGGAGDGGGADGAGAGAGGVGRRQVAGLLAAGALGAFAGATGGMIASGRRDLDAGPGAVPLSDVGARTIPYHGVNQPGIVLPFRPQARAWVGGFDLEPGATPEAVKALLQRWTVASRALMAGRPLAAVEDRAVAAVGVAADPLVAGLGPAALTVTVGFGPSFFDRTGWPRPEALTDLPAFNGDQLDPARGGGAIGVVVAADDALIVAHAARLLTRLATGTARSRWSVSGFNAARGSGPDAATPRNLMGQVDGTNNPRPDEPGFAAKVFTGEDQPAWLRGGSYLVVRRIRMLLDDWDQLSLSDQERVIGRRKDTGAPLSGGGERTPANFGHPDIPADAHIRHAAPAFNDGAAMLRRGFSFVDGNESGLLFLAWQADPRRGFIPVQRRLSENDALRRFIRHETSALFAMPGGVDDGGYLAQALVGS